MSAPLVRYVHIGQFTADTAPPVAGNISLLGQGTDASDDLPNQAGSAGCVPFFTGGSARSVVLFLAEPRRAY
ncbi:hypothetical protein [Nocardia xishanensis]|uniref:hypothetical protein n=1 Tax=Nocardia xishanensis TaxID=238964 RepID=UPI000A7B1280|nr:hypothetical protein [Nocardia xishanensis]